MEPAGSFDRPQATYYDMSSLFLDLGPTAVVGTTACCCVMPEGAYDAFVASQLGSREESLVSPLRPSPFESGNAMPW